MVRLLHFRELGGGSVAEILSAWHRYVCLYRLPRDVRSRISGAAVWSDFLRADRRPDRAQICIPGYAVSDGPVHGCDWSSADLQNGRMVRTHYADRNPGAAGAGAGRGVWRGGSIRRREFT